MVGSTVDALTIASLIGGLFGAVVRAVWTKGQENFGPKTVVDVITGGLVGILYPVVGLGYPEGANLVQKAAWVAFVSYTSSDVVQNLVARVPKVPPAVIKPMILIAAAVAALAGCAGPFSMAGSPEQIHELAKVKDANVTCIIANTPYGKGTALF